MFLKFKKLFIILKIPKPPYTCSQSHDSHPLLISRNQPLNLRDSSPRHPQLSNGWKKSLQDSPIVKYLGSFSKSATLWSSHQIEALYVKPSRFLLLYLPLVQWRGQDHQGGDSKDLFQASQERCHGVKAPYLTRRVDTSIKKSFGSLGIFQKPNIEFDVFRKHFQSKNYFLKKNHMFNKIEERNIFKILKNRLRC